MDKTGSKVLSKERSASDKSESNAKRAFSFPFLLSPADTSSGNLQRFQAAFHRRSDLIRFSGQDTLSGDKNVIPIVFGFGKNGKKCSTDDPAGSVALHGVSKFLGCGDAIAHPAIFVLYHIADKKRADFALTLIIRPFEFLIQCQCLRLDGSLHRCDRPLSLALVSLSKRRSGSDPGGKAEKKQLELPTCRQAAPVRVLSETISGRSGSRRGSVAQSGSAAGTSSGQDLAAVGGGHSLSEAMDLLSVKLFGLVSSFHCS